MPKRLTPRGEAAPPVEPIVTGATLPPKPAARRARKPKKVVEDSGMRYVRNLHHIKSRVTLSTGRDINLEPRGQREDLDVVNADDQEDPRFLANLGLIFELITPEEAKAIIAKQQTNTKQQENSLWDHLRNEKGKPYEQRHLNIEEAFERQGVVVGEVKETGSGRFTDKNFEITRAGPQIVEAPGSPNHPATHLAESVPSYVDPGEYHEFLLWKQFKAQAEAAAIRASLDVTVEPVQSEEESTTT